MIGIVILLAIFACLAAVVVGGFFLAPDMLTPLTDNIPALSGTQAPVLVENYSDYEICYLNIAPSSNSDWGNDLLRSATIPPGSSQTFWVDLSASVDMQALDCGQNLLNAQYGIPFTTQGLTYAIYNP